MNPSTEAFYKLVSPDKTDTLQRIKDRIKKRKKKDPQADLTGSNTGTVTAKVIQL